MKMWKRFLTYMFAAVLCFGLAAGNVQAAGNTTARYTYTVTFYAGNQGDFKEEVDVTVTGSEAVISRTEDKVVVSGLAAGAEVGITAQDEVALDASSKYYVKGIRLSGRDNASVAASVFKVNGDADYVVAYGIKGNQVSYTVNYQDVSGRELAPSDTFYGNVGDKPVVAYKFINGYAPKALGLTKTLSENAAENVFTFVYINMPTPTINEVVTEVITEQVVDSVVIVPGSSTGGATGGAGGTGTAGDAGEETDDEGGTGEEGGEGAGEDGSETGGEDGIGDSEGSGEEDDIIVDLDDEDVPLANQDPVIDDNGNSLPMLGYVGLVVAAMAALVVLTAVSFILRRRSKEEVTEEGKEE